MPYKGPIKNHINMCGSSLCPATLVKALALADLTWGVPMAQYVAMQMWGLQSVTELKMEVKEDSTLFSHKQTPMTLMGLPVEIDRDLPNGTVQLRYKGASLFEIQMLAIPTGFEE